MKSRYLLHIIAPTIAISILLCGLGVFAAWNVQRQQAVSVEVMASEMHAMLAAQDLLVVIPELRHELQQYLRNSEDSKLLVLRDLEPRIQRQVAEIRERAPTPEERRLAEQLEEGCDEFFEELHELLEMDDVADRRAAVLRLLDSLLMEDIVTPAKAYLDANRRIVDRTNQANRRTADQMRQAFLLLGVCGSAAGLVAGLAIARGIGQSMLKIDVSVRGAADRLEGVVGPVRFSSIGGFRGLEAELQQVEEHVNTVVQRLEQRELESLRNQQLAAVGQLAAGLAHELRNPLVPMKMLVQKALASEGDGLTPRQLEVLNEEIQRLERLVQEFLDFARPQPAQLQLMDLQALVEQVLGLVRARASVQGVTLSVDTPPAPLPMMGDAKRLQQVLLNLLLNSLDAQPAGGRIDVRVRVLREASDSFVEVRVRDQGPGLAPEILARLFEPFFSTKETGTGLGLSICQRIVTEHGGLLTGENAPEGGAAFCLRLPFATNHSVSIPPLPTQEANHGQIAGH